MKYLKNIESESNTKIVFRFNLEDPLSREKNKNKPESEKNKPSLLDQAGAAKEKAGEKGLDLDKAKKEAGKLAHGNSKSKDKTESLTPKSGGSGSSDVGVDKSKKYERRTRINGQTHVENITGMKTTENKAALAKGRAKETNSATARLQKAKTEEKTALKSAANVEGKEEKKIASLDKSKPKQKEKAGGKEKQPSADDQVNALQKKADGEIQTAGNERSCKLNDEVVGPINGLLTKYGCGKVEGTTSTG